MHKWPSLLLLLSLFIASCEKEQDTFIQVLDPTQFEDLDSTEQQTSLPKITGFNGSSFIDENGDDFFPWGLNYNNPQDVGLIEDNWDSEDTWEIIEEDFREMKVFSANIVRIHLQYHKYMLDAITPNSQSLDRLARLVEIAEKNELYLLITGLGAYKKYDAPAWYNEMNDKQRWDTQKVFWKSIAKTVKNSSTIFAYDLMNEPVVGNSCVSESECDWVPEFEFGGYYFIQNISINPNKDYWETLELWIGEITSAIRKKDQETMITVGLLPLGQINSLASSQDFVSTHVYPETGDLDKYVQYLSENQSNKALLLEEFYNLLCSTDDLEYFLQQSEGNYHGVIGHYFGKKLEEYDDTDIVDAIHKDFMVFFMENNPNKD